MAVTGNQHRGDQNGSAGDTRRPPLQRSRSVRHSASFSSSSARRLSSSATRFLNAGSARYAAADFNQSRCGIAGEPDTYSPGSERARNPALRRRHDTLADTQMPRDADLPGQDHVVLDDRAAGNTDLRRQNHTPADADAVGDVHEVVDFRAGANPRFADGRPIDRAVRADLNVVFDDDGGGLGNLEVRAVGLSGEPEAVAADHDAVVKDDAMADDDSLANRRRERG